MLNHQIFVANFKTTPISGGGGGGFHSITISDLNLKTRSIIVWQYCRDFVMLMLVRDVLAIM